MSAYRGHAVLKQTTSESIAAMLSLSSAGAPDVARPRRGPRKIETVEQITRWARRQVESGMGSSTSEVLRKQRASYLRNQLGDTAS